MLLLFINIIAEVHYYYKRGIRGDNHKIENIIHIMFKRKIIINFVYYIYTNEQFHWELEYILFII